LQRVLTKSRINEQISAKGEIMNSIKVSLIFLGLMVFVSFICLAADESVADYACSDRHASKNIGCKECIGGKGARIFSTKVFPKKPSDTEVSEQATWLVDTTIPQQIEEASIAIHESSICKPCGDRYEIRKNNEFIEVTAEEFCEHITSHNKNCGGCLHVYIVDLE